MSKLKYQNEITGEWESMAPSQQEFDDYALETNSSLLTKATKQDLQQLQGSVEFADVRLMGFVIQKEVVSGIQDAHYKFPFDGEILEMDATCAKAGASDTYVRVEKSTDMQIWNSITTNSLVISAGEFFDGKSHILFNPNVNKGDIFRVNVEQVGDGMMNLTVNVKIKIRNYSGGFFP